MDEKYKKYVVNLKGKDFITFAGLLAIAHDTGLVKIETSMKQHDEEITIFKARVTMSGDKVFEGYGDANKTNVGAMILPHRVRMAETRAIARALRWATCVGMTASEELGGPK